MFGWFAKLFAKDWTVAPCGCKFYQGAFTPLERVECDACREQRYAEARARPPEPDDTSSTFLYGPIADGHAASDCGGDGGGGDGGGGE